MRMFILKKRLFMLNFLLSSIFIAKCEAVDKAHTYWMTRNSRLHSSPPKLQNDQSMEGSVITGGYEETLSKIEQVKNFLNLHPVMLHLGREPNREPNRKDLMSIMYMNFDPNGWPTKRQENQHIVKKDLSP